MTNLYAYTDIRQSQPWFSFWESLGWKKVQFSESVYGRTFKTHFGPIILVEKPNEMDLPTLKKIEQYAKENKACYVEIKPGINQKCDLFEDCQYKLVRKPTGVTKTGLIDLTSPKEGLYKAFSKITHHLISKEKEKLKFEFLNDYGEKDIEDFYEVYKKCGTSKSFFTYSKKEFQVFMETFKYNCFLCQAKDADGKYLGGCVFTYLGKTAWYMFSAMNKLGQQHSLGYPMLWEGISFLKSKGFEILDLEGLYDERYPASYQHHQGYSFFKERFNPKIIYFPKIQVKYFNTLFKLLGKI